MTLNISISTLNTAFDTYDKNHDGHLDVNEITDAKTAIAPQLAGNTANTAEIVSLRNVSAFFDKITQEPSSSVINYPDFNRNGTIEKDEISKLAGYAGDTAMVEDSDFPAAYNDLKYVPPTPTKPADPPSSGDDTGVLLAILLGSLFNKPQAAEPKDQADPWMSGDNTSQVPDSGMDDPSYGSDNSYGPGQDYNGYGPNQNYNGGRDNGNGPNGWQNYNGGRNDQGPNRYNGGGDNGWGRPSGGNQTGWNRYNFGDNGGAPPNGDNWNSPRANGMNPWGMYTGGDGVNETYSSGGPNTPDYSFWRNNGDGSTGWGDSSQPPPQPPAPGGNDGGYYYGSNTQDDGSGMGMYAQGFQNF